MTTTVRLITHGWPVEVQTEDNCSYCTNAGQQVVSHALTTETVPPHSERDFHITDTRSISFKELPVTDEAPVAELAETAA